MKKALFITSILILLVICMCVPISAFGTATVVFDADNDTPARGTTVVVTVALNGSDMAKSMMIQPVYDSSVLELQSGEWLLTGAILADDWSEEFGDAAIAYSSATDVNGDIFEMTFKVLDDAALGNTTVDCNVTIMNGQSVIQNISTPINIKISCVSHSYVEKVDEAYFKSNADCTHKTLYYTSCSVCGEKGTDTFEIGDVLGHEWSSTYSQNAQGHYRTCTRTGCGVSEDSTACSGGTKTCTTQATCSTCLKPYGTTLPHDYANGMWKSDASGHWKKCKDCTAEDTESKVGHNATDDNNCATAVYCTDCNYMTVATKTHNLTIGASKDANDHIMECTNSGCDHTEDAAHNFNQQVESADYLKNNADCTTAKTYYYSCECGHKGSTTFTVGSELGHDFSVDKHDADNHWQKCSRCEEIDGKEAHNGGTATCTTKKVCTDCNTAYGDVGAHNYDLTTWGYKAADGHAHVCKTSGCNAHDTVVAHTSSGAPTEANAEICTVCQYVINPSLAHTTHIPKAEWSSDATHHWHECTGCSGQQLEKAEHIYDNACDTTCNTCGYERTIEHNYTELKHSDTEHWYECVCGAEKADSRVTHSGGEVTCTAKAKCSVCDTEYGTVAPHSYATEWSKNDTEHWHECACGEKSDKAEHAYGDDNVCDACGYENESQGGTEPPSTDTTPAPVDPGTNSDDDNGGMIAIIIIACVVALGVGWFVLYWFVFKKRIK